MSVLATVRELMGSLVHPDARVSDLDAAEHAGFMGPRLGLTFSAVAVLAAALAAGHVPAPWEAASLAWLTLPLVAAMLLSRTGRLGPARAVSVATWAGFGATAVLGGGLSAGGACAPLLVIAVEAVSASSRTVVRLAGVAACLGLVPLLAAPLWTVLPERGPYDLPVLVPSLAYGLLVAALSADGAARRARARAEADRVSRVAADLAGDLLLRCDRGGSVLDAGRAGEPRLGLRPRDLLGRGAFDRVHVADRPAFLKAIGDAAAGGETARATLRLRVSAVDVDGPDLRDPVFAWVELRARRDDPAGVVAILRDASAAVRPEASAHDARREAGRAGSWQDGLIATVSHELRTPLNAVIGFSEILSNADLAPADPARRQDYAAIVAASGRHMLSVVDSLLEVSGVEAGRLDPVPAAFDVPALIQACCDMVGLQAEQAGVALRHERGAGPVEVTGDARAYRQIVVNLLSNALKFTGRGGRVSVGARVRGRTVVIAVADTGPGIAAADLRHVGTAFFQGRAGRDRPVAGTGLGLSIVRGLVGAHGGRITLDTAVGAGTRVQVHLPLDCRVATTGGAAAPITVIPRATREPLASEAELGRMQKRA